MALLKMLAVVMLVPAMAIYSIVMHGCVIKFMWGWFIIPTFYQPKLSIASVVGISTVINLFRLKVFNKSNVKEKKISKYGTFSPTVDFVIDPIFALMMDWIVQRFM